MVDTVPILTLVPPLIAIGLVVATRKVLLSLGLGVVAAALLIEGFSPWGTVTQVLGAFAEIFWVDGAVNTTKVYILVFTLMLGVITALIMMSGGTRAFADWAQTKIRTRRGATLLPAGLGVAIFVDDYFNALAVGQVSRPVTDTHRVSRAKLAYLVDSTSAPVAVLAPFSSWGAFILGLIGTEVAASSLDLSEIAAFLQAAGANYYAFAALLLVAFVAVLQLDLGAMRAEERRAILEGRCFDESDDIPGQLAQDLPVHRPGAKLALIVPFVLLVVGVLGGIVWTGQRAAGSWSAVDILASTDVTFALIIGGVLGLAAALYYYVRDTSENPRFGTSTLGRGWLEGVKSMMPAVSILVLAWMLGALIEELGTGEYLAGLIEGSALSPSWLVPIVFLLAASMAFATGTSWGSFGLLIPLAGGIINSLDAPELLLPALGAVLAGAVAGDHASPISDTTILSATGAGCNVITHVTTQLPYMGLAVVASTLGYVAVALGGTATAGLAVTLVTTGSLALIAIKVWGPVVDDADMPQRQGTGTASGA
ncbi:Malate-2H(+)/Na(+)-lactate antiporter [Nocardioides aquaticus]|uniref:Malate-2H(+)/Na(+)-lactate antiporter n=2 Tax=Actinomycetes TaxID=1760 RepID=A0ABX8EKI2_9ACTN|nr:Na+/H+ antiporter NhaC family protein [Nocardioides aquaticus]QVT80131.1 Malate-2H(+)/Na(+)-lactate antiporter [Nocardioides aquaticus]